MLTVFNVDKPCKMHAWQARLRVPGFSLHWSLRVGTSRRAFVKKIGHPGGMLFRQNVPVSVYTTSPLGIIPFESDADRTPRSFGDRRFTTRRDSTP